MPAYSDCQTLTMSDYISYFVAFAISCQTLTDIYYCQIDIFCCNWMRRATILSIKNYKMASDYLVYYQDHTYDYA